MKKNLLLILVAFIVCSCANFKMHVDDSASNAENKLPLESPSHVLYAIGDAGYLPSGAVSPALVEMGKMMEVEKSKSSVVFLGDNIYPAGMPPKKSPEREQAEKNLDAQIDIVRDYKGKTIFIPGNHDWRQEDAQKGVSRQEKYIEKVLDEKVHYPDDGCAGPEKFKLGSDAILIVFDSEWFLQNWDNQIDFNEHCEIQSRSDFIFEITNMIKKYAKEKRVIIAMHHPIHTYGVHGGKYSVRDHIMPLAVKNEKLKIPLPALGLIYPFFRKNVGERQDLNGERYKELRQSLFNATAPFDNVVFIAGHEHNMQYIQLDGRHQIVAGSGCKKTAVAKGKGSEFSYAELGFSKIYIYEKGETWMELYACDETGAKRVFLKKLADKVTEFEEAEQIFTPPASPKISSPILAEGTDRGNFFHFLLGRQYSELYNIPLQARAMNLSIKEGGLTGIKRGGGFQTNSVRLSDSRDRHWVMRAMRKNPNQLLPSDFQNTFAIDVVDHFLTTAHPLAAFTIPDMAEAIDIMHTKPELVYIPKQQALGEFNEDHGDQLYLFEARPAGDRSDLDYFGNSENIINTLEVVQKMKKSGRNRPDQPYVVRNRLFDMILGDWDRHDDQWRWAEFEGEGKNKIYRPIPRDRDQAFSIFEGPLIGFARIFSPGIAKFQTFDEKIKHVDVFNFNARYFDRSFLNELTWADWEKQIQHIQANLTDEAIQKGLKKMQTEFYERDAAGIEQKLKARRNGLTTFARDYYLSLAKSVDIMATEDADLVEVIKKQNHVEVTVSDLDKSGERNYVYYNRVFSDKETKEIVIYGLDGDDQFNISGEGSNIKIRLVGGADHDEYNNTGSGRRVKVYDYKENSEIASTKGLDVHLTNRYDLNTYDRKAFKYNDAFFLPLVASNPDNGLLLGGSFKGVWHGFKKDPHKMTHEFSGLYSFATNGFRVKYEGHFVDVVGRWNLRLQGSYQSNLFSNNFFGIGNNTINPQEDPLNFDLDYNRVRNTTLIVKALFENPINKNGAFFIGPKFESRKVDFTANRFISSNADVNSAIFSPHDYWGGEAGFKYYDVDNKANPHQGIDFLLKTDYLFSRNNENIDKASLNVHLAAYFPLDTKENFIWANKVGGGFTFSDDAFFYHKQQLGGQWGLRGYRNERFTGNSALFYNTDVRFKLFSMKNYIIPATIGAFGGFDVGRVWDDDAIESNIWHTNFGGGLWASPFNAALIKVAYFTSPDETGRFLFSLGFDF